jgi:cellulose synthase operon protein C
LKSCRDLRRRWMFLCGLILACAALAEAQSNGIPSWLQFAEAGTRIENALFRSMPMPGGAVLARRPPAESRPLLDELIRNEPQNVELYSLRALQDEQQLDFAAAERDWKLYAERSSNRTSAQFALADFYHRRAWPADEIQALEAIAQAPTSAAEQYIPPAQQQAWHALERILAIIQANALATELSDGQYRTWIARYPREPQVYTRYFNFLLARKQFDKAEGVLAQHAQAFPQDSIFAVQGRALLATRRGNLAQGLGVYNNSFQPLWPAELVKSYFDLLRETQNLRKFLDESRARLTAYPEDLNASARVFYYYRQEGKDDAALQTLAEFRLHKERSHTVWTAEELYTLARLHEDVHSYSEAARYYFALYNAGGTPDPREHALAGLANVLLAAPEQPLRLGAGDLSFYKDVATLDPGPGFFNGILSLLLNSNEPRGDFAEEEQRVTPYFHRARAAELVALIDRQFPNSPALPSLHARLMHVFGEYGANEATIRQGQQFLKQFPNAAERTEVALLMADAYARLNRLDAEFATYDNVLRELAEKAHHLPLSLRGNDATPPPSAAGLKPLQAGHGAKAPDGDEEDVPSENSEQSAATPNDYPHVLDHYLARLVSEKRLPQALEVLRREVETNPNDPGLYERLAQFLDQNRLDSQVEDVYRRAMQQFSDRSWDDKLARFYLRQRREADLDKLTQEAVRIFSGTELEAYFRRALPGSSSQFGLQLNLYANHRFPHDLVFVRNLLTVYETPPTRNLAAWEALLRQHWFEAEDLRNRFFLYLSSSGRLEGELAALQFSEPEIQKQNWKQVAPSNPAAAQFYAEAEMWRSHFEAAAPALGAIAQQFPGDFDCGRRASSVYRSLAYFDPRNIETAADIERNLQSAEPINRDTLARIGDIYADHEQFAKAAPYWQRMAAIEPGRADSFVQAATVFWDYYKFDDALRVLNEGRGKLGNDALFGYQEGAIYENERHYPRALAEYVKGALAEGEDSFAVARLVELARRPSLRDAVDAATRLPAGNGPASIAAIRLRVTVLAVQNRKPEMQALLRDALQRATTLEFAQDVESIAQKHSLEAVYEQAIEREAALTTDPVTRLQLRYRLVQFYESKKDFAEAQRGVEALYRENPRILGVVRATVDYFWQHKMRQRAVEVLLEAAKVAHPDLRSKLTFEAARKSTDAGNFALARRLVNDLLEAAPYDAELLAANADTYARAGDNGGLRDFYLAEIELLRNAALPAEARAERVAALRRGLIPALTRLKDFPGAVDQYIELINRYPEDASLVSEAALYAGKHQLAPKLLAFYTKTVADSPRDYHWPMTLARIQVALENYSAAVEAYAKAIAVRPDRVDLYAARADLFERLARSDEAAADYEKLYALSYHDSLWMMKLAAVRARQGRIDETVRALKTALVEGRPPSPLNLFAMAEALENWGLLAQARDFAQQAVQAAGRELLADQDNRDGAKLYTRILVRSRQHEDAFALLEKALQEGAQTSVAATVVRQVEKQGIAAVTDSQWRAREQKVREDAARAGFAACMKEAGQAVARYFAPEEKSGYEKFLETKRPGESLRDVNDFLLPAVESAGLAGLEARWRVELMMADPQHSMAHVNRLVALQSQRLEFGELGRQLEAYAASFQGGPRAYILSLAAEAYRSAEDTGSEIRVRGLGDRLSALNGESLQRYLALLLAHEPEQLTALAARGLDIHRDAAANFAVDHGAPRLAYQVLNARAAGLPPVWLQSYTALAGLYLGDGDARVGAVFHQALAEDSTIGERLGKQVDRRQQLAGDEWFYYGARYGEYLGLTKQGNAEDLLPAGVEHEPGNAEAYLNSAQDYLDLGDFDAATREFHHALDLAPDRPLVHDQLAQVYWKQNNRVAAVAEWRSALAVLEKEMNQRSLAESFWTDFAKVTVSLRQRHLALLFKTDLDRLLRTYVHRNGVYRDTELLRAACVALDDPSACVAWLLDLSNAAPDKEAFLADIGVSSWIPDANREPLILSVINLKEAGIEKLQGEEKEQAQSDLRFWRNRWLSSLIQAKQFAHAADVLTTVFASSTGKESGELIYDEIEIKAGLHGLDALLERFRAQPESAPKLETLQSAAQSLDRLGLQAESRKLMQFAYARAIDEHDLSAPNFLGLAEIRLQEGDFSGAVEILRRLTLVVGQPNENLDSAAALLEKTRHPAEAAAFLQRLVSAKPWNYNAQVRWAIDRIAVANDAAAAKKDLVEIARSTVVPYEMRAAAAEALAGGASTGTFGSRELDLLAAAKLIPAADADQPFFFAAREKAALAASNSDQRVNLLRAALRDRSDADSPRIPLFFAAVEKQEYALALGVIEPLLRNGLFAPNDNMGQADTEESTVDEGGSGDDLTANENGDQSADSEESGEAPGVRAISQAMRARIAADLALVEEYLGQITKAIRYSEIEEKLEASDIRRKKIHARVVRLQAEVARQAANEARRVVIHSALEQDRVVRPRLAAQGDAKSSTAQNRKGGQ